MYSQQCTLIHTQYNRDVHTAMCRYIHNNNNNRYVLGSASNLYTVYTHVIASVYGCVHDMRYRREFVTSAPLSCHAGSRGPMRMRTNIVYFRVMRRLYRREWNWLWNWLCVNQHPWQQTRGHGVWRLTSIAHWECVGLWTCVYGIQ